MFTKNEFELIKKALYNMKDPEAWTLLSKVHSIAENGSTLGRALNRARLMIADLMNLKDNKECPAIHIACGQLESCQFFKIGYLNPKKTKECWKQHSLGEEIPKK